MNNKILIVVAATVGSSYFVPGVASAADAFMVSPFGNAPVRAYVGRSSALNNAHVIQWRRKSDNACLVNVLSDATGLNNNVVARGGTGSDNLRIVGFPLDVCGTTLTPPIYNGFFIDLDGFDGNDSLGAQEGDTWLWGGKGNDFLYFFNPFGQLLGFDGDDTLISASGIFTAESLFGQNGNDCLEDSNSAALNYDCGPGNDSTTMDRTPVNVISCESTVFTCPDAFQRGVL